MAQLLDHLMHIHSNEYIIFWYTENGYYLVIEYKNLMHLNILGKTIYTCISNYQQCEELHVIF